MLSMKVLILSMGILALITFFGIPSRVDAHLFSGISSIWTAHLQKAVPIVIGV